jgi:hypothetical protein
MHLTSLRLPRPPTCPGNRTPSSSTPATPPPLLAGLGWPQKHTWTKGLTLRSFDDHVKQNEKLVKELRDLSGGSGVGGPWAG